MLQIQIDGKEVSVEQGATVIEAAQKIGTYIPHFCYHKKLSIAANCRMCLVEVEKAPKPLPACATPVTDGMVVHTHSAKARQAQEGVMEFLLINHPLDCPVCDQGGECQLQDLAMGYGKTASRYTEAKRAVPGKDMGPLVGAEEMSRCIHCTRCVRFTEEVAGMQEIAMSYRGEFSEIMPFVGKVVETELSGNVIDLCPVGALTSKPFRFNARSWELSRRKSVSAHDALGSNLIVQTKDHTVRRVLPLENEAVNECWIADRDRFAYEGLYHESRLKNPKIKQGGEWMDVDWKTALEYVRNGIECIAKDGNQDQVGIWANPMNTVEELFLAKKLADGLGIKNTASRLRQQDGRLAGSLKGAQWLGGAIADLNDAGAVLVVGANLRKEQPLLTARLRRAAGNGTQISILAANKEQLFMPLAAQESVHPAQWAGRLKSLTADLENGIAGSLKAAEKAFVLLGADAQNHPDYAAVYAAAQELADAAGAKLGILPQAANSVGADLLRFDSGSIAEMVAQPRQAVLLLNVEPEIDVAGGAAAVSALKQAKSVMAFTPFESDTLLEVCDILLPIAPFTETSGSLVNMEGRLQSFHGVVQGCGDSRPLWKILRVLGNLLEIDGFDYDNTEAILQDALDGARLPEKLDNRAGGSFAAVQTVAKLTRVGGVGIYHTDPIVRRSAPLQETSHAQIPAARIHPQTLADLGLAGAGEAVAKQNGAAVRVSLEADDTLPQNVVHLPLHPANAALGGLMNAIVLERA
ncbi:NADH-quinone oxidoreductase chain 3 [Kingella potus]|uniref:NADH-quinone oxidoreductase n=1 Tax=Kingella potus TaxID=265175 RepID=A0A377R2T1_9NEIS|nr:NADH-quinone oxidoreductase subunit NuoG [Kingella potus]STR02559.1 NADH-quinone oxidoreductase chain 3 [Kingella potus]